MTTTFPLGPYHPALPEPIWYQLQLEGEIIREVEITTGYCSRGVETLLTERSYQEGLKLAERLCGTAAHHHRLAFCLAMEQLAGVQAPPPARAVRSLFCEIERVLSHLNWSAHLAHVADLPRPHYLSIELRERLLEALERATGQRFFWGLPIPGGVAFAPEAQPLVEMLEALHRDMSEVAYRLSRERHMQRRTSGLASLTKAQASGAGLVGPLARASGLEEDVRRYHPYDAYRERELAELYTARDTHGSIDLRLSEVHSSIEMIEQLLADIPEGPLAEPFPDQLPAGAAEVSVEGPQGRETWQIRCDGSERPAAVKITTASQRNLAAVPLALQGQRLGDALLILASLDICVACVDK